MKKMTAKQKPAKRKPREWVRWAIIEDCEGTPLWAIMRTRAEAVYVGNPGDEVVRVRITEIVK